MVNRTFENPMGFQIFSVRARVAENLAGSLKEIAAMGYTEVELCSFKGFAGDKVKGDFGSLAEMSAADLSAVLNEAGMTAPSCHFNPAEFEEQNLDAGIKWAAATGVKVMVLAPPIVRTDRTPDERRGMYAELNRCGEYIHKAGLQFGLHPQADMWKTIDGKLLFDELLESVDAANCVYELDLSATFVNGIDAGAYMARNPGRFSAVHLRDLKMPQQPVPYIFSLPLGRGEVDWRGVLDGAGKGGVEHYIVEMVVQPPADSLEALKVSADYLRTLGC
jgi:sugar phosphate isomerase/epimerase